MGKQQRGFLGTLEAFGQKYKVLSYVAFIFVILGVAHSIYFKNYYQPADIYWDEVYHIPSAAKYIQKVHFMEPHPPLGKMFIAWGEMFITWGEKKFGWQANGGQTFNLEKSDVAPLEMPEGFTFAGYRLFPALAGWANALVFALVLLELFGSRWWAIAFLPLYLFDNALIVQSRGAMLDSLMLFGALLCLWGFVRLVNTLNSTRPVRGREAWALAVMVFGFSFAIMTKVLALALVLLWPALLWIRRDDKKSRKFLLGGIAAQILFCLVFCGAVWAYHFNNSQRIEPTLREKGFYYVSSDYEQVLAGLPNSLNVIERYWAALRDNVRFFFFYERGVETYDLNKGHYSASHPISWPFGARPIVYRRNYPDEEVSKFLIMVPNVAIWFCGLLGVILSFGAVAFSHLQSQNVFSRRSLDLMSALLFLYIGYMAAVAGIRRALFLYHYMIPLIISFLLFAIVCHELVQNTPSARYRKLARGVLSALTVSFIALFLYNRPLTYYRPLSCQEAHARVALPFWSLDIPFCKDPSVVHERIRETPSSEFSYEAPL